MSKSNRRLEQTIYQIDYYFNDILDFYSLTKDGDKFVKDITIGDLKENIREVTRIVEN